MTYCVYFPNMKNCSVWNQYYNNCEEITFMYTSKKRSLPLSGLGYGPFMKAASYQMDEGVKQGDMEAMPNFCIGINQTNKSTHDSLQEKGGVILSGADDTYILGPPQIAFPEVKLHEERLASIGLKLN